MLFIYHKKLHLFLLLREIHQMTENLHGSCWLLRLMISLAISGAYLNAGDCTFAQITPDSTLPNNSTVKL